MKPAYRRVLLLLATCLPLVAQAPVPTEYQVKAAYLSNFGRFVEWPARTPLADGQPFHICVLGDDPFGSILDSALSGELIKHSPLVPKRITRVQDAAGCRIVFVSASEASRLKTIVAELERGNALTVSDIPQFAAQGGAIELVLVGKTVRFQINLAGSDRAGLSLSSELLKLALSVRKGAR